jgi:hypothetical protein
MNDEKLKVKNVINSFLLKNIFTDSGFYKNPDGITGFFVI